MTLAKDLDLEEYITAKDDLSGADIKVTNKNGYTSKKNRNMGMSNMHKVCRREGEDAWGIEN